MIDIRNYEPQRVGVDQFNLQKGASDKFLKPMTQTTESHCPLSLIERHHHHRHRHFEEHNFLVTKISLFFVIPHLDDDNAKSILSSAIIFEITIKMKSYALGIEIWIDCNRDRKRIRRTDGQAYASNVGRSVAL